METLYSFRFNVNDGQLKGQQPGLITIRVRPIDDLPVALDGSVSTDEDVPIRIDLGDFVTDPDTNVSNHTFEIRSSPAVGSLSFVSGQTYLYTPPLDRFGTPLASFTFRVRQGNVPSNLGTISINVRSVNDPPTATPNSYVVAANSKTVSGNVLLDGVADSDVDGDALKVDSYTQGTFGTVSVAADGRFTYTANSLPIRNDAFTYTASDGRGGTARATVTISVNTPPVVTDTGLTCVVRSSNAIGNTTIGQISDTQTPNGPFTIIVTLAASNTTSRLAVPKATRCCSAVRPPAQKHSAIKCVIPSVR